MLKILYLFTDLNNIFSFSAFTEGEDFDGEAFSHGRRKGLSGQQ
jgi:hypothetical protein